VTSPSSDLARGAAPRWTREQIRAPRVAPLLPLLSRCGLSVVAQEAGNFLLPAYPGLRRSEAATVAQAGLIVKDSCWRWPERELAGNAIDFFMRVLGLSFHDAMRAITGR
jgi:hypothetical protein